MNETKLALLTCLCKFNLDGGFSEGSSHRCGDQVNNGFKANVTLRMSVFIRDKRIKS